MNTAQQMQQYPYRVKNEKIPSPSQQRINKVSQKSIFTFNVLEAYFCVPFRFRAIPVLAGLLKTVINRFFAIQFLRKLNIIKTPVTHVDHELDDKVPFEPQRVGIYMDFINLWIRPLSMLIERYGRHKSIPLVIEWMKYLTKAYYEASRMYLKNMTTTYRPDYRKTKAFRVIHRVDPHYLCVPSLHIAIVCLCYSFYQMIFEREEFTETEKTKWNKEFYAQAINISETVLYIKQHSVNCIPAALYMLTKIVPELYTAEEAESFIDDLFTDAPTVMPEDREKILKHIHVTFEKFVTEGKDAVEWYEPILNWLHTYKSAK